MAANPETNATVAETTVPVVVEETNGAKTEEAPKEDAVVNGVEKTAETTEEMVVESTEKAAETTDEAVESTEKVVESTEKVVESTEKAESTTEILPVTEKGDQAVEPETEKETVKRKCEETESDATQEKIAKLKEVASEKVAEETPSEPRTEAEAVVPEVTA